ncbi:MAG: GspE/PulE family protein [Methylococcales bacterium]|nr:GspE/PulE family protein [Methylococcales bacterium]
MNSTKMTEQELCNAILNSENFEYVTNNLSAEICLFLGAERITVFKKGLNDNEIISRFKTDKDSIEIRVPLSTSSIAGYVALSQQPLFFEDVHDSSELKKVHTDLSFDYSFDIKSGFSTKAMIAVPIKRHNVLLGVLQILNKADGSRFNNIEAKRALLLARIIGKKFSEEFKTTPTPYDFLVQKKLISLKELQTLEKEAAKHNLHPSHLMTRSYKIPSEMIGKSLELFYQVPYQPYDSSIIPPKKLLSKIKNSYIRKNLCVPISGDEEKATIVIDDPSDYNRILEIQKVLGIKNFIIRVSLPSDILNFLDNSGINTVNSEDELKAILDKPQHIAISDNQAQDDDEEDPEVDSDAAPVIQLINRIIDDAVHLGASDIHIEPGKDKQPTIVRMRIDGECREIERIPYTFGPPALSRIKVMSNLDIAERRLPQDGKCKRKVSGKEIELRVSTLPTVNGESAVLRVLSDAGALPIEKLNLSEQNSKNLMQLIKNPHGIFLVVGPTGSGKTTTLHAILGHLNTPDKKIWTAEDPVEITQPGLQQVQIQPKIGFDFASAMRSFLRADPDIILIGEMRDRETSHVGVEASLTGHMVLSTLHTNSAPETITRLLDLGLDSANFSDALLGILAQRLMRTLCSDCKTPYFPDEKEMSQLKHMYGETGFSTLNFENIRQQVNSNLNTAQREAIDFESDKIILFKATGCRKCDQTGYRGRVGIHEMLVATDKIKSKILNKASIDELRNQAIDDGMHLLHQDGVLKILSGLSDIHQLHRVVAENKT